jgi:hypothetical protein
MSSDHWSGFTNAYAMPVELGAQTRVEPQLDHVNRLPEPKLPFSISGEMDWMNIHN